MAHKQLDGSENFRINERVEYILLVQLLLGNLIWPPFHLTSQAPVMPVNVIIFCVLTWKLYLDGNYCFYSSTVLTAQLCFVSKHIFWVKFVKDKSGSLASYTCQLSKFCFSAFQHLLKVITTVQAITMISLLVTLQFLYWMYLSVLHKSGSSFAQNKSSPAAPSTVVHLWHYRDNTRYSELERTHRDHQVQLISQAIQGLNPQPWHY